MGKRISQLAEITTVDGDDLLSVVDVSDTTYSASGTNKRVTKANLLKEYDIFSGWIPAEETWTYASADAPTFTFTISGDKTSKYSVGMKIKLTQTTVKYFIITAISYSSPNTTVTVYGGTDYTLANATITNPYYSTVKTPQGFPISPAKWSVVVTDSTIREVTSPTQNTWYNPGSINISIPIGVWYGHIFCSTQISKSASTFVTLLYGLSTTSNGYPVSSFLGSYRATIEIADQRDINLSSVYTTTSKTTLYMNILTTTTSIGAIYFRNDTVPMVIRFVCAYL